MSARSNFGVVVAPEVKLAIALRYLAGGDPLDLKLIYHVGKMYVYDCVYLVINAINATLSINFPLTDVGKLKELEADFRAASRGGCWEGQVGAIDGVHFAMRAPSKKDVPDPMKYFVARKDEYAILCIAVCDAHRRFTSYDISKSATTHDPLAWAASDLGAPVAHGELHEPSSSRPTRPSPFPIASSLPPETLPLMPLTTTNPPIGCPLSVHLACWCASGVSSGGRSVCGSIAVLHWSVHACACTTIASTAAFSVRS